MESKLKWMTRTRVKDWAAIMPTNPVLRGFIKYLGSNCTRVNEAVDGVATQAFTCVQLENSGSAIGLHRRLKQLGCACVSVLIRMQSWRNARQSMASAQMPMLVARRNGGID